MVNIHLFVINFHIYATYNADQAALMAQLCGFLKKFFNILISPPKTAQKQAIKSILSLLILVFVFLQSVHLPPPIQFANLQNPNGPRPVTPQ